MKNPFFKYAILVSALLVTSVTGLSAQSSETSLKRDAVNTLTHRSTSQARPVIKASSSRTADETVIRTGVLSKDSWIANSAMEPGMYEYSVSAYNSSCLKRNSEIDPTGGGAYIGDGKYFSTSYAVKYGMTFVNHYIIDTDTWATVSTTSGSAENIARDLAYDHISGKLYGCFRGDGGTGYVFGTIDPLKADNVRTVIAKLDNNGWNAMSVDRYGNLYAIDRSGVLYQVDKGSGAQTKVGNTGLTSKYQTSGAIDQATNKFYFVTCNDNDGALYSIDLQTAKAEKVYDMLDGEQVGGMYIPASDAAGTTLAAVSGLSATFDNATRKGTLSFTAPSAYTNGTTASGKITYSVTCSGTVLASGTATCGAKVNVPITVDASGSYIFIVTVSDSKGTSPEAYLEKYIGYDCPVAVGKVDIAYSNDRFTISWPASTEGVYGGLFDKANVTYTVTRMPDGKVIADRIKQTSCEDIVSETTDLITYRYTVTPHHQDATGSAVSSAEYLLGAKNPPYEVAFASQADLEYITIIDANKDGRIWMMDMGGEPRLWLYPTSVTKGNDYIFSAPVRLEGGRLYKFTADMGVRYPQYGNKEIFDACLATAPSADACIQTLIEPTTISTERDAYSAVFRVEQTGKYYVGIHGCSDPDSYGLYAYGMSVVPDAALDAPDAPQLSALADINGEKNVAISVTAPARLLNGESVGTITRMELYRDGTLLTTWNTPAAGADFSYSDKNVTEGLHIYSACAYNNAGAGKTAEAKAYAGINIPAAPIDAVATVQADNRTIKITWKAPETDVDGCPINPDFITYTVARYDGSTLKWIPASQNIKGDSYTETVSIQSGTQAFIKYGVFASSSKGDNTTGVCEAPIVAVGDPYAMPYVETFGGTTLSGILGEDNENESASWQIWDQYDQDGDGRCLFYSGAIDKRGSVFTGKIHISGDNPAISFWYWSIPTSENEEIVVEINDGTGYKQIGVTPMNRGGDTQHWEKYSCTLKEYIGKDIQVRLSYIIRKYVLYIDNLRICDSYQDNLSANSITVPTKMDPEYSSEIIVVVENSGEQTSRPYAIDLYVNGEKTATRQMPALAASKKTSFVFEYEARNIDPESTVIHAVIDYDDENMDDNVSEKKTTMVLHRDYPVVSDLKATRKGDRITLGWSAPELDGGNVTVTDDAEHYVPFSTGFLSSMLGNDYVGDWTMYDGDGEGSNGLAGFPHDNIAAGNELSFIVFNPAELGIVVSAWQPRSGHQAFVCLCAPKSANDDWMISPRLSGNAQTVSFYAKSVGDNYNERFEFLYSSSDTDVSSFTKVQTVEKVPAKWTEYRFDVPAGTTHFAIRCISNRQFALFVDDITFERANPAADLQLIGYNVYRDGVRLTASPTADNAFSETDEDAHRYLVTAVYDRGESAASNEAIVGSLASISGPDQASDITITGSIGKIIVSGAEGKLIEVFSTDGKVIDRVKGSATTVIDTATGLYIVRVAGTATKTLVK